MKITTIHGLMDEEQLEKRTGAEDNESETVNWTEYWLKDELVHRSVDMYLKQGLSFNGEALSLS